LRAAAICRGLREVCVAYRGFATNEQTSLLRLKELKM
jgi:hypothetical protein